MKKIVPFKTEINFLWQKCLKSSSICSNFNDIFLKRGQKWSQSISHRLSYSEIRTFQIPLPVKSLRYSRQKAERTKQLIALFNCHEMP
jgi:hypothetical protein